MSNDRIFSRKRTIIEQHQAFFDSLEKYRGYKPQHSEPFGERKSSKIINVPQNKLDYQGEDFHNKGGGFISTPIFKPSMLDFRSPSYQDSLIKASGGLPLPDECDKILKRYDKLRQKTQKYRNPKRSIMKELKRKNKMKAEIIKKNITIEFK